MLPGIATRTKRTRGGQDQLTVKKNCQEKKTPGCERTEIRWHSRAIAWGHPNSTFACETVEAGNQTNQRNEGFASGKKNCPGTVGESFLDLVSHCRVESYVDSEIIISR